MFIIKKVKSIYKLNIDKVGQFNNYVTDLFTTTYSEYEIYLISNSDNENYQNYILNQNNKSSIFYSFYNLNKDKRIKSNIVLTGLNGDILFSTFDMIKVNDHFLSFNNIMKDKVIASSNEKKIETGLYIFNESPAEYVMASPIIKDNIVIGFIMLYLNGNDWNYEISSHQCNGVITDLYDNIIATSNKMIANGSNKFISAMNKTSYKVRDTTYLIKVNNLKKYNVNIYSLVEVSENLDQYILGVSIIIILGISLIILAKQFAKKIALNNSLSINKIVSEIDIIKKGNLNYKISLETNDEIEIIANSVNEMVEKINLLNAKNAELLNIKKISEIKQLEAQFNPHFLYNTLETIRYSILFDGSITSDLINLLTKILRYSINNDADEVMFSEDIKYTKVFLKIQKYRFNNNFNFDINVDKCCNDIIVPKLLLQPIIENSIKYGFKSKSKLKINIRGKVVDKIMVIVVEDDGPGIKEDKLETLNKSLMGSENNTNHYGLFNISRRLYLQFGERSSLHVESKYMQGTKVVLKIDSENHNISN